MSAKMSFVTCAYLNCWNRSTDVSMFRFPVRYPDRLAAWIRNAGNERLNYLSNEQLRHQFVCASHFPKTSIHQGPVRARLIGNAIPVPFMTIGGDDDVHLHNASIADTRSSEVLKVKTPTKVYLAKRRITDDSQNACESSTPKRPRVMQNFKERRSCTQLLKPQINDTPRTKTLRSTGLKLLKKSRALEARLTRKKKKTTSSTSKYSSEASKTIALMQLRKPGSRKKWTSQEKNFCLSLYYKSPATYQFMLRQGVILAAITTIKKWLSAKVFLPGLCPTVMRHLKLKFESAEFKEKACCVAFDEMSILSNLEYSKKYDFIEGFEDLGNNKRNNLSAKYALVFVARGIYASWQLPLAYYLSSSNVKTGNLILILKSIISNLFDVGLLTKAIVCDQASTNQKLYKDLGTTQTSPYFFIDKKKIFALFDTPHLIKNIRNNLLNSDFILEDKIISFRDIVKTYAIDKSSEKSRCLTKITDKHIYPNSFQKMNVSLATQIFSNSVAAAILTVHETGQLKSPSATETARFVKIVNDLFDALNSKTQFSRNPYNHALSKKSTLVLESIKKGILTFSELMKTNEKSYKSGLTKIIKTRPPCFDGIIQTCEAILQLYSEERSENENVFILTNKFNQDNIENLFARFRQKGGFNRNPSAKLFRTTFRSHFIYSLMMKTPKAKNCEDDPEQLLEIETPSNLPLLQDKDYSCPSTSRIGEATPIEDISENFDHQLAGTVTLEQCSINYFAGYLAHLCLKKFNCSVCLKCLTKDKDLDDPNQILILNKSYNSNVLKLKVPTEDLVRLVKMALECFQHCKNILYKNQIKTLVYESIKKFIKSEAPELLNISCEEHIHFILNHMILVKILFYCKYSNKAKVSKNIQHHPKIKILCNE